MTVEQQVKQFLISAPLSGTNYPVDKGGPREIDEPLRHDAQLGFVASLVPDLLGPPHSLVGRGWIDPSDHASGLLERLQRVDREAG